MSDARPDEVAPVRTRWTWALATIALLMAVVTTFGECYPVSSLAIFDRYSEGQSRLVARTSDGTVARVTAFDRYRCPRTITLGDVQEGYAATSGVGTNLDKGAVLYVRGHMGVPTKPQKVDLLVRTLRFRPDEDTPVVQDHVLQRCEADALGTNWQMVKIWTIVRR